MGWEAWLTLAVTIGVVVATATERVPLVHAILSGVAVLLVFGVVEAEEAFSGFSNPAPLTVAALFVVAKAVGKSGVLEALIGRLLGTRAEGTRARSTLARAVVPTAVVSGFMNSTPIVAMVAPAVAGWARRVGRSASHFLMPISFGAILGGLLTVLGTSTNLVVSGLMDKAGQEPMGLFEIAKVGLPLGIAGVAVVVLFGPSVLPTRVAPGENLSQSAREFTVELRVSGGAMAGKTVADAGLRNLQGVFLIEIERGGQIIAPVAPDQILAEGDRLTFAGNVERIMDLQRMPGLAEVDEPLFLSEDHGRRFYEAVVAANSPLVGMTLKGIGFRGRYRAAVFAIHRAGARVAGKLGDVRLGPGDVLLIIGHGGWGRRWRDQSDFSVVTALEGSPPLNAGKARIVAAVIVGLFVLAGTGVLDILPAAMVAGLALIGTKTITRTEARESVDIEVVVAIAASFGLGAALSASGLATTLADGILAIVERWGDVAILAGVLIATSLLTEVITNNAAAVLMFPIAMEAAGQAGLDPRPLAFAVAVGASMSFLTPVGYQTNTMVYGMGGYRFADFMRLGSLLSVVLLTLGIILIPIMWPLRP